MDDLRSLREQRDELRISLDEIMERNDSIDDVESIEKLEKGAAKMAEMDKSIRSAEARAAYESAKSKSVGSYGFKAEKGVQDNSGSGEYRFVIDGSNVRVEGRAAEVGAPAANIPAASLDGMDLSGAGSYSAAIPVDLQAELIRRLPERTVVRRFFSSMNYMNDIELQRVATRVQVEPIADHDGTPTANKVSVTDEAATYATVDMSLQRVRTNNFKSAARSEVTEEFMRDARGRAVAELLLQHTESHGLLFDKWYAGGAGGTAGPEACWDGAESYIPGTAGLETGQIGQVDMDEIGIGTSPATKDNAAAEEWTRALTNLRYGRIPAQYWGGLRWMFSQEGFAELTKQTDANGRPLFNPLLTGTAADSLEVGTLLGLPVFVGNNLPNSGVTSGNTCCILAHSEDYRIFDRMPLSQQVDPYSAGDSGKIVYRTRMRSDGRWLRPYAAGMLLWNQP